MTVRELQERLSKLDPNLEVLCYTEDPTLQATGHMFRLLDIEDVRTAQGKRTRIDEVPSMKFGSGEGAETVAVLEVTPEF